MAPGVVPPTPVELPLHAWMACLPTEVKMRSFCELALPGAHNAGACDVLCIPPSTLAQYVGETLASCPPIAALAAPFARSAAICQHLTIGGLLRAGIRILDFRLGLHNGEVHICHTVICGTTLREALQDLVDFLRAEEQAFEVVAVLVKRDWHHQGFDTPENWELVQACMVSILGNLLVTDTNGLGMPMAELCSRGQRALVLVELPHGAELSCGLPITKGNFEKSWRPDTKTVEDMLSVLQEWRHTGRMRPERGRLKLLEVALPGGPSASAPRALACFRDFLQGGPLAIGTVLDFPDEETVRAIVAKNWGDGSAD